MGNPNHDDKSGQFSSGDGGGGGNLEAALGRHEDEADQAFLEQHGVAYEGAMDEAWNEYGIRAETLGEVMDEFKLESPDAVSSFLKENYRGEYSDEEDFAQDYLDGKVEDDSPVIPKIVADHVDKADLNSSLTDGPYASFYNSDDENYHYFKRKK